ncbi:hypothetical protein CN568_24145 [Bacillus pseudomycoides]|uniref:hypothetical protein n=1 Tax=Bacillus TaxID=1386 RepID=UPI000380CE72|nr:MULTISPECIES: hypothetical protein [Bacillus]PEK39638.1 hypothetical protein CN691_02580 [Bacillus pseudomycoides]PEK66399.1 hypothetical protein CN593_18175 [Bacillus pseudomycoides]PEP38731.1 hypothetical protein CN568_24145 [Bacillus pseudomycoides]PEP40652.1 hypothetical protein CN565_16270 [Bacillus pseudomycoides]PFX44326.1 hypothetical protein COL31_26965 [Bacillus pseudomycoides]
MKNTLIPEEGKDTINNLIKVAKEVLRNDLVSIYGMGSLGYGGFVNGWSDFDIDIILADDTDIDFIQAMYKIEGKLHDMGYGRVDVKCYSVKELNAETLPYTYGTRNRAVMLCDSATLIYGENISDRIVRPSIEELRKESISLVQSLLSKDNDWWFSRPIDDTAALLALPARLVFTCTTGEVTHKAKAIDYLMEQHEKEISPNLWAWVIWARACREIPYAQNLPRDLYENAIKAAHGQMLWVENQLLANCGVKL